MSDSQEDFFGGASHPAIKFANVGDAFKGTIVDTPTLVTRPHLTTGEPEQQLVVNLDDGSGDLRSLWVRKSRMSTAIREAYTAAGAKGLEAGGVIAIAFIETTPPKTAGHNPAKVFKVKYVAPTSALVADASSIFDD